VSVDESAVLAKLMCILVWWRTRYKDKNALTILPVFPRTEASSAASRLRFSITKESRMMTLGTLGELHT
jgi:hypothetical protein